MAEQTSDIRALTTELVKRLNEDLRRIRNLEINFERLESTVSSVEDFAKEKNEEVQNSIKKLEEATKNLSERLADIETNLQKFRKDLEQKANRVELKETEHFVDLMSSINSSFVTKEQLERILEEKIGKKV